jgi:hypothetical protein
MIDIVHKKCIEDHCDKIPSFNYETEIKGIYCANHKKDNMINFNNDYCIEEKCNLTANFNYSGKTNGIYCSKHKKDDMINIKSHRCKNNNCNVKPCYGNINDKIPTYCKKHALDNMINIISPRCINENCDKIASFNFIDQTKVLYCAEHKLTDMTDIHNRTKKCKSDNCNIIACFNYPNLKQGLYCYSHKLENMIDVKNVKLNCKSDMCDTRISNDKYKGYCLRCFVYLYPYEPNARNYKTKEVYISNYIHNNFKDINIIIDKNINGGCSNRRPDILIDLNTHIIIVEIDENQHKTYDDTCENKRLMEISADLGHPNIIFIRFNPDNFINKNNQKISSCWKINKEGICILKKDKINEWNQRVLTLKYRIEHWINNIPDKHITIEKIYFDGYI